MRLTDIAVRQLPIPEKGQRLYYDDVLPAFGCRVSQGGTRSFFVQHGAERQFTTIGRHPIISLADARGEAKRILAERTLGRTRPKSIPFEDALTEFFAECEQKNRPRTVRDYRRLIGRYFKFARKPVSQITHEDIVGRLPKAPAERNHALVAIKIFLTWAQKPPRRYIPHNPCEGMTPTKRPSRKRVLSDAELAKVLRAAIEGADSFSRIVGLLVCTGQRRGEVTALQRPWIAEAERTITLPEQITKNKLEHTLPYGQIAAAIIESAPRWNDTDYLFPARCEHVRGKPTTTFNGFQKAKAEFDERCGVTKWTLHDLRRTFGTRLAELAVPPHVIERLLNHKMGSISSKTDGILSAVAEVYNRYQYLPEMREAMNLWEGHLASILARPAETLARSTIGSQEPERQKYSAPSPLRRSA
jgi:integrase